jgi:hypothetical protein
MFTASKIGRQRRNATESSEEPSNSHDRPSRPNRIYSARPWTAAGSSPIVAENSANELPLPAPARLPGDARGSAASLEEIPDEIIIDPTKIGDSATRHLMEEAFPASTSSQTFPLQNNSSAKPRLRKIFARQQQQQSIETIRSMEATSPPPTKDEKGNNQEQANIPAPKESRAPETVITKPEVRFPIS